LGEVLIIEAPKSFPCVPFSSSELRFLVNLLMGLLGTGDDVISRPMLSILSPEILRTCLTVLLFEASVVRLFFPSSLSSMTGVWFGVFVALPLFPLLNFLVLPPDSPTRPPTSLGAPFLMDRRDFPVVKVGATIFGK
jgi:hypothetical protein